MFFFPFADGIGGRLAAMLGSGSGSGVAIECVSAFSRASQPPACNQGETRQQYQGDGDGDQLHLHAIEGTNFTCSLITCPGVKVLSAFKDVGVFLRQFVGVTSSPRAEWLV